MIYFSITVTSSTYRMTLAGAVKIKDKRCVTRCGDVDAVPFIAVIIAARITVLHITCRLRKLDNQFPSVLDMVIRMRKPRKPSVEVFYFSNYKEL